MTIAPRSAPAAPQGQSRAPGECSLATRFRSNASAKIRLVNPRNPITTKATVVRVGGASELRTTAREMYQAMKSHTAAKSPDRNSPMGPSLQPQKIAQKAQKPIAPPHHET